MKTDDSAGMHPLHDDPGRFDTLGMFRLIADKIERDPALLQIGLDNIARWIANGANQQHRLRQWENIIHAAQDSAKGIAAFLAEAIGRESLFHSEKGYHVDILHPTIVESLPPGWEGRLVPMAGFTNVFALDPYDLAATKLVIGREKDIALVRGLLTLGKISLDLLRARLNTMPLGEKEMFRAGRNLGIVAKG
jgi:hypothetical protein